MMAISSTLGNTEALNALPTFYGPNEYPSFKYDCVQWVKKYFPTPEEQVALQKEGLFFLQIAGKNDEDFLATVSRNLTSKTRAWSDCWRLLDDKYCVRSLQNLTYRYDTFQRRGATDSLLVFYDRMHQFSLFFDVLGYPLSRQKMTEKFLLCLSAAELLGLQQFQKIVQTKKADKSTSVPFGNTLIEHPLNEISSSLPSPLPPSFTLSSPQNEAVGDTSMLHCTDWSVLTNWVMFSQNATDRIDPVTWAVIEQHVKNNNTQRSLEETYHEEEEKGDMKESETQGMRDTATMVETLPEEKERTALSLAPYYGGSRGESSDMERVMARVGGGGGERKEMGRGENKSLQVPLPRNNAPKIRSDFLTLPSDLYNVKNLPYRSLESYFPFYGRIFDAFSQIFLRTFMGKSESKLNFIEWTKKTDKLELSELGGENKGERNEAAKGIFDDLQKKKVFLDLQNLLRLQHDFFINILKKNESIILCPTLLKENETKKADKIFLSSHSHSCITCGISWTDPSFHNPALHTLEKLLTTLNTENNRLATSKKHISLLSSTSLRLSPLLPSPSCFLSSPLLPFLFLFTSQSSSSAPFPSNPIFSGLTRKRIDLRKTQKRFTKEKMHLNSLMESMLRELPDKRKYFEDMMEVMYYKLDGEAEGDTRYFDEAEFEALQKRNGELEDKFLMESKNWALERQNLMENFARVHQDMEIKVSNIRAEMQQITSKNLSLQELLDAKETELLDLRARLEAIDQIREEEKKAKHSLDNLSFQERHSSRFSDGFPRPDDEENRNKKQDKNQFSKEGNEDSFIYLEDHDNEDLQQMTLLQQAQSLRRELLTISSFPLPAIVSKKQKRKEAHDESLDQGTQTESQEARRHSSAANSAPFPHFSTLSNPTKGRRLTVAGPGSALGNATASLGTRSRHSLPAGIKPTKTERSSLPHPSTDQSRDTLLSLHCPQQVEQAEKETQAPDLAEAMEQGPGGLLSVTDNDALAKECASPTQEAPSTEKALNKEETPPPEDVSSPRRSGEGEAAARGLQGEDQGLSNEREESDVGRQEEIGDCLAALKQGEDAEGGEEKRERHSRHSLGGEKQVSFGEGAADDHQGREEDGESVLEGEEEVSSLKRPSVVHEEISERGERIEGRKGGERHSGITHKSRDSRTTMVGNGRYTLTLDGSEAMSSFTDPCLQIRGLRESTAVKERSGVRERGEMREMGEMGEIGLMRESSGVREMLWRERGGELVGHRLSRPSGGGRGEEGFYATELSKIDIGECVVEREKGEYCFGEYGFLQPKVRRQKDDEREGDLGMVLLHEGREKRERGRGRDGRKERGREGEREKERERRKKEEREMSKSMVLNPLSYTTQELVFSPTLLPNCFSHFATEKKEKRTVRKKSLGKKKEKGIDRRREERRGEGREEGRMGENNEETTLDDYVTDQLCERLWRSRSLSPFTKQPWREKNKGGGWVGNDILKEKTDLDRGMRINSPFWRDYTGREMVEDSVSPISSISPLSPISPLSSFGNEQKTTHSKILSSKSVTNQGIISTRLVSPYRNTGGPFFNTKKMIIKNIKQHLLHPNDSQDEFIQTKKY